MFFRPLVVGVSLGAFLAPSFTPPSYAALLPAGRFDESRYAVAKFRAQGLLDRLVEGMSVGEVLATLRRGDPAGAHFFDELARRDRLNPKETIRLKAAKPIPQGWELTLSGVAGKVRLTIGTAGAPAIHFAGKTIPVNSTASEQYRLVRRALREEKSAAAPLWDFIVPSAEANPVVLLPVFAALGCVVVMQALARYFAPAPEAALRDLFREGGETCAKERVATPPAYEGSATAALVAKLQAADVAKLGGKAGECGALVTRMTKSESDGAGVNTVAQEACRQADAFLACAEKFKRAGAPAAGAPAKKVTPATPAGSSGGGSGRDAK